MSQSERVNIKNTLSEQIIGLAHIGHIVSDLKTAISRFKKVYGVSNDDVLIVPPFSAQDEEILTRFAFVTVGNIEFELIEPLKPPFIELLQNSPSAGGGLNHIAWQVDDIQHCLTLLSEQGIKPGHVTPDGIVNLGKKHIVYLCPQTTGGLLIELIEVIGEDDNR
ncbi:VOC family protein [Colwellia sp. MEBiC06753]